MNSLNIVMNWPKKLFPAILHKKVNGSSALDDYRESKVDIKNLAMAMTSFINKELLDTKGNFSKGYPLHGKASFRGHLQATRALVAAGEYFNIKVYQRAAVRAYYGLNVNFYNPTTQFYKTGGPHISSADLALTLETLERLEPWVHNTDSKNQLGSLLSVWRESFRSRSH